MWLHVYTPACLRIQHMYKMHFVLLKLATYRLVTNLEKLLCISWSSVVHRLIRKYGWFCSDVYLICFQYLSCVTSMCKICMDVCMLYRVVKAFKVMIWIVVVTVYELVIIIHMYVCVCVCVCVCIRVSSSIVYFFVHGGMRGGYS